MRLLTALFLLSCLTACQTNGMQSSSPRNEQAAAVFKAITFMSCIQAKTPEQSVTRCTKLVDEASRWDDENNRTEALIAGHSLRGLNLLKIGEDGSAEKDFDRVIAIAPNDSRGYLARAALWEFREDLPRLISDVDRAIALDQTSATPYRVRAAGRIALAFADRDERGPARTEAERQAVNLARSDIAQAKALEPRNTDTYRLEGDLNFELADYDTAIGYYGESIEADRENATAYAHRGSALFHIGDHSGAVQDYQTAIRLQPNDPARYLMLGWVLAASPQDRVRDGARAIEMARTAQEMYGDNMPLAGQMLLPVAYAEYGDFDTAVREQERIIEAIRNSARDTDDDDTLRLLGLYIESEVVLEKFRNREPFRFEDEGVSS